MIEAAVDLPELLLAGEPLPISVSLAGPHRAAALITVTDESGHPVAARGVTPPVTTSIAGLAPGVYTVEVTGLGTSSAVSPVSSTVLIWPTREYANGA
jgi:hypothetical protein